MGPADDHERSRQLARFFRERGHAVVLRRDRRRTILRCEAAPGIGVSLAVKIFEHRGLPASLLASLRGAAGELSHAASLRLAASGIPVPEPYGSATERGPLGLPVRSLAASVWIGDMVSLRDHAVPLFGTVPAGDPAVRALSRSLGGFIAQLHHSRIWAPDLNAGNFLVRRHEDGRFRILLMDHDEVRFVRTLSRKQRIVNLSQVAAFLLPLGPDAPADICEGYASSTGGTGGLTAEVRDRAAAVLGRWERDLNDRFDRIGAARKGSPQ